MPHANQDSTSKDYVKLHRPLISKENPLTAQAHLFPSLSPSEKRKQLGSGASKTGRARRRSPLRGRQQRALGGMQRAHLRTLNSPRQREDGEGAQSLTDGGSCRDEWLSSSVFRPGFQAASQSRAVSRTEMTPGEPLFLEKGPPRARGCGEAPGDPLLSPPHPCLAAKAPPGTKLRPRRYHRLLTRPGEATSLAGNLESRPLRSKEFGGLLLCFLFPRCPRKPQHAVWAGGTNLRLGEARAMEAGKGPCDAEGTGPSSPHEPWASPWPGARGAKSGERGKGSEH